MGMCYKKTCQHTPAGAVAMLLMMLDQGSTDAALTSSDGSFVKI